MDRTFPASGFRNAELASVELLQGVVQKFRTFTAKFMIVFLVLTIHAYHQFNYGFFALHSFFIRAAHI